MPKNHLFLTPASAAMSSPHSYTVVQHDIDDLDDGEICPVCDGECTCHPVSQPTHTPQLARPSGPLSMAELSVKYASNTHSKPPQNTHTFTPVKPSLKIKLTLPPTLASKSHSSSSRAPKSKIPAPSLSDGLEDVFNPAPQPKKRGRPPKAVVAARELAKAAAAPIISAPYKPLNPKSAAPGKHAYKRSSSASQSRVRQKIKARAAVVKKSASKNGRRTIHDSDSSDDEYAYPSSHLPTFLPQSALPSVCSSSNASSSSEDSSLTDFDTDSSIEQEEETFIISSIKREKARTKRELLGGDDQSQKRKNKNNDWIIRPRKKSVGLSDDDMDVDSDLSENDDDDDEDEEENEEEEDAVEADIEAEASSGAGNALDVEDDDTETDGNGPRAGYVGLATGWSEDEDESFDADLFFANLSDTSETSDSDTSIESPTHRRAFSLPGAEDGDQSDLSSSFITGGGRTHVRRHTLESLPFEITEGWDGQIVFTNGIEASEGIVNMDFEEDARVFASHESSPDSDVEMSVEIHDAPWSGIEAFESCLDDGDDGYEEEDGEACGGDTTDEELVGDDCLPNERAMRLFSFPAPLAVHAINPLSTVSPVSSPARGRRQRIDALRRKLLQSPADILAGNGRFLDSAEDVEDEDEEGQDPWDSEDSFEIMQREGHNAFATPLGFKDRRARSASTNRGPRAGVFVPTGETKQAIIGDKQKGGDVPSPHPRFSGRGRGLGRGRGRSLGHNKALSAVDHILHYRLLESLLGSSGSIDATSLIGSVDGGEESCVPGSLVEGDEPCTDDPIQLDDVLDTSFLRDSEVTATAHNPSNLDEQRAPVAHSLDLPPSSPSVDKPPVHGLSRWDVVPVGAFRQTRESAWESRVAPLAGPGEFDNAMRTTPLNSILWPSTAPQSSSPTPLGRAGGSLPSSISRSKVSKDKLAKRRRVMMGSSTMSSPLILPISGDRTPVGASTTHKLQPFHHQPTLHQKSKKESKKERKLKKKITGLSTNHHSAPPHQFHGHHHHPNSKMRGQSSSQRSNFSMPTVPPLNL